MTSGTFILHRTTTQIRVVIWFIPRILPRSSHLRYRGSFAVNFSIRFNIFLVFWLLLPRVQYGRLPLIHI